MKLWSEWELVDLMKETDIANLEFQPVTAGRWSDLETLFGKNGACGGCWCMWWRLTRSQFVKQKGEDNRKALRNIVASGDVPGILAYCKGVPIGWCAVAPRESYPALERSRVLGRVNNQLVWSVVCFFVSRKFRRQGMTSRLLNASVDYVRKRGGKIIEGYPVEPKNGRIPDSFAYTGLPSAFRKAGFVEVLRRARTRPIMRYMIEGV
jgi:GNAT superfamily N-acetyltransferase